MATVISPYYRGGGAIQNLPYWPCKFKGQEVHYDNKDFCLTIPGTDEDCAILGCLIVSF